MPNLAMKEKTILSEKHLSITLHRLCHQLTENHRNFDNSVLIGIQPRGVFLMQRIKTILENEIVKHPVNSGSLDITFYRDDFRHRESPLKAEKTDISFSLEDKKVVLIDDVLFTGRTIRAAMDALLDFGRPQRIELLVLIDRRYARHLPIQADYVGLSVDSVESNRVNVYLREKDKKDKVTLFITHP